MQKIMEAKANAAARRESAAAKLVGDGPGGFRRLASGVRGILVSSSEDEGGDDDNEDDHDETKGEPAADGLASLMLGLDAPVAVSVDDDADSVTRAEREAEAAEEKANNDLALAMYARAMVVVFAW